MKPRTLRGRLVVVAAGSILAAVLLFGAATLAIVDHQLNSSLDSALRQRAQNVARLSVSAPAVLISPGALDSPAGGRQIVVEVIDSRRRILARSLSLGALLLPQTKGLREALGKGTSRFENVALGARTLRVFAAPIADAGGPAARGAVLVASDTSDIRETTHDLAALLAISALGAVLIAALTAALLTRRGLAPLTRLSGAAHAIELSGNSSQRLPNAEAGDEVGELTDVLNRMLQALDDAREGERRFLADASHELRTPVTTLLGNVEYAVRNGADPDVMRELRADAERIKRLVEDLLALERSPRMPDSMEPVRLDEIVRAAVAEQPRATVVRHEPVTVRGDARDLRRALDNLVENAVVHGPDGTPIEISLHEQDGRALLSVTDAGEGPPAAERDKLFARFWRGATAAGKPGSGLGLAIVASIAEHHGGTVRVERSSFTIDIPAQSDNPHHGAAV